ncbi:substrate-binding domain-containing protein [Candidatus Latescibacterota bacterium]
MVLVDGIFTPNESTKFSCLRTLQNRSLAGKIIFVRFDSSKKIIEALEKGEIQSLVIQNPFKMGYLGLRIAVSCLKGEEYENRVDTGATVATPENMHYPVINKLLLPDISPYLD